MDDEALVRRHFTTFLGGGDGGLTTEFVRTLVARRHAACAVYQRKTQVVHVCAKPFFAAIGEPDSRNRRPAEPAGILRKLLTLDVVLAHKTAPFLASTAEKVAYFTALGVPSSALPRTRFHARNPNGVPAVRHFVDKAPVWADEATGEVVFAYVRTPVECLDGLRTWLAAYASLLAQLVRPRLLIVATNAVQAAESASLARRILAATTIDLTPAVGDWRRAVQAYFGSRALLDSVDPALVPRDQLARLRADQQRFTGASPATRAGTERCGDGARARGGRERPWRG